MHIITNKCNTSTPKWKWQSSSDPSYMALLGIPMPLEYPECNIAVPWAASIAEWCLDGGGHSDSGNGGGNGDNSSSSDSDARGCIARAG